MSRLWRVADIRIVAASSKATASADIPLGAFGTGLLGTWRRSHIADAWIGGATFEAIGAIIERTKTSSTRAVIVEALGTIADLRALIVCNTADETARALHLVSQVRLARTEAGGSTSQGWNSAAESDERRGQGNSAEEMHDECNLRLKIECVWYRMEMFRNRRRRMECKD